MNQQHSAGEANLRYVDPRQGTDSVFEFSNGNTLPLVCRPFGMAAWIPQTTADGERWLYRPGDRRCYGIRLTHQPSPWISDYGQLALMPATGKLRLSPVGWSSSFDPAAAQIAPDHLGVDLVGAQVGVELAPSTRGAALRFTFRSRRQPRLMIAPFAGESSVRIDPDSSRISGWTRANSGGVPENFATYFVIELDCGVQAERSGVFADGEVLDGLQCTGERRGAFVGLDLPDSGVVTGRVATSYISLEQAQQNLRSELTPYSLDEVRDQAEDEWSARLGAIEVEGGDEATRRTFYTCLYRTFCFPHTWHEYDEAGRERHYSPASGTVEDGPMYCDVGFWDVFRTSLPLYTLLIPEELGRMIEGWVNFYRESGALPRWLSPGERYTMPGTLIDVTIADAVAKAVPGFDQDTAYAGLLEHATGTARPGMDDYRRYGFLPHDRHGESVNNTLDYLYGDFCIAQVARARGDEAMYAELMDRVGNYVHLFDTSLGLMRGRNADGTWQEPFDPLDWGDPFCEGSAWQCSWAVPYDLRGLAARMGGNAALVEQLDRLLAMPAVFNIGSYGFEIHEMSEMAAGGLGQFAISNQPSFHIPYIYAALGRPDRTQYWVRRTLAQSFSAEPDGLPGDEDNGSLTGWYVWSALGLYPLCPGVPEYVLGSPLFTRATVHLGNGEQVVIEAENNGPDQVYWSEAYLDGEAWPNLAVPHERLMQGGRLRFAMSAQPARGDYTEKQLPYSLTPGKETV